MLHHTLSWLPPCPVKLLCAAAKVLSGPRRQQDPGRAHWGPQEEQEPLLFQQKFDFFPVFCFFSVRGSEMQPARQYSVAQQPRTCWEGFFAAVNLGWREKMRWGDTQNLPLRLPRQQDPYEQAQVSSREHPGGNVSWEAAALHLLLLCIWSVLKPLVVITQN